MACQPCDTVLPDYRGSKPPSREQEDKSAFNISVSFQCLGQAHCLPCVLSAAERCSATRISLRPRRRLHRGPQPLNAGSGGRKSCDNWRHDPPVWGLVGQTLEPGTTGTVIIYEAAHSTINMTVPVYPSQFHWQETTLRAVGLLTHRGHDDCRLATCCTPYGLLQNKSRLSPANVCRAPMSRLASAADGGRRAVSRRDIPSRGPFFPCPGGRGR